MRVLSFGAGTQSSAVLGLIEEGKLPPVDFAVFADTQCEPDEVYEWLDKIKAWAKTEIIIATAGNLMDDALKNSRFASMPLYTSGNARDDNDGQLRRQCTREYKIAVVQKAIRKRLGYAPKQHMKHHVDMLIAMSLDEVMRMKDSREKWITNKYPLIFDIPMHRQQSIDYVKTLGLGTPPRSSCMVCPFHSNAEWKHIKDTEPHNWQKIVTFDKAIRKLPRMQSETFLHKSCKPIDEIDFNIQSQQLDLFQNECEGMCGA